MMAEEDQFRQKLSLFSVVLVMVFIGIPLWWKTTDVYRSPLPYSKIQLLQKQVPPVLSLYIDVVSLVISDSEELPLLFQSDGQNVVLSDSSFNLQCLVRNKVIDDSLKPGLIDSITNDKEIPSSRIGQYTVFVVDDDFPMSSSSSSVIFSTHRYVIIKKDSSNTTIHMVLKKLCGTHQIQKILAETSTSKFNASSSQKTRRIKVSPGYQITMTLINPNPMVMSTNWSVKQATEDFLLPFLKIKEISLLGQFSISSQVLYYTDVHFKSVYSQSCNCFLIKPTDLPQMISTVEAKLGSHVSQWPGLNFIVYVSKHSEWPLYVRGPDGSPVDSFLVPQWGGVIMYNDDTNASNTVEVFMEDVIVSVVRQLKLLLGLPENEDCNYSSPCLDCNLFCVSKWDIDHLLIGRALESIVMATSSLYSLTSLLDNVKNMVISDHIQQEVLLALEQIEKFHIVSSSFDWHSAYLAAGSALNHSETAFFDPSILALLYFPDDQKYAIYIPLFLPISVPVIIAVVSALKKLKNR